MRRIRGRIGRDERGTALILAIAFMLVIGAISGAVLSSVTSGLNGRVALDNARNREYAADGLIDFAIAKARTPIAAWNTSADVSTFLASASSCGGSYQSGDASGAPALNGFNNTTNRLHVDCTPAPGQTRTGALTRNAIFTACPGTAKCTDASAIVRAQVNFDSGSTIVQSWSVNG